MTRPWLRDAALLLGLLVLIHALPLSVHRELWVQDEARYGEVLREMLESGRWLVPHLNGHPYPDKPPLYFWLVAALGAVLGQGELAFRAFTVLSTGIATLGVWLLGRRLLGERAGFWGAVAYQSAFVTLIVGQIARMDMLLAASAAFAWYALLRLRSGGGRGALLGFWGATAVALAVKGPIALLFTAVPGLAVLAWEEGLRGLKRQRPLAGLGFLAACVLGWVAAVLAQGEEDYLLTIWHEQLIGRAIDSWSHREPFWFYAVLLPLLLLPWTGLIVAGTRTLWRERLGAGREIMLFTLLPLAGISLISGKLFIYVQPLVPALALIAGLGGVRLLGAACVPRTYAWLPALLPALLAAAIGYFARRELDGDWRAYLLAGTLAALALAVAAGLPRLAPPRWLAGAVGAAMLTCWLTFGALLPLVNPLFSGKAIGEAIARHAPPGREVGVVEATRGILNYYAGRTFAEVDIEDAAVWRAAHPEAVLVVKSRDLRTVFGEAGPRCDVDEDYEVELKQYHVLAGCR